MQAPIESNKAKLSVYLHRVLLSTARHDRGPRVARDGRHYRPSIPLDLHYLVTAWSSDARTAHQLLGWAIRVLHDTPVLPTGLLNTYQAELEVFGPEETVELAWEPMSVTDVSDIWQVSAMHQAPSATYVARSVVLDSEVALESGPAGQDPPVRLREGRDMSGTDLERLAHVAPFGMRLSDAGTGRPIVDGITVRLVPHPDRRRWRCGRRPACSAAHGLAGLRGWERRDVTPEGAVEATAIEPVEFRIEVRDGTGSYHPFSLRADLPSDGLVTADLHRAGASPPDATYDAIPLFSLPARAIPVSTAVVRARLVHADDHALRRTPRSTSCRRPVSTPCGASPIGAVRSSWCSPIHRLRGSPARRPPAPSAPSPRRCGASRSRPPSRDTIHDRAPTSCPISTCSSTRSRRRSPPLARRHTELHEETLEYGRELVLRSSTGDPALLVGA